MFDKISGIDLAVIAAYLLGIVAVGCYAGLKKRREGGANRYFLAVALVSAGRRSGWPCSPRTSPACTWSASPRPATTPGC